MDSVSPSCGSAGSYSSASVQKQYFTTTEPVQASNYRIKYVQIFLEQLYIRSRFYLSKSSVRFVNVEAKEMLDKMAFLINTGCYTWLDRFSIATVQLS